MVRRTKEEALQTRQALLDAAEVVFDARGVSEASLQEIAALAGVTRGAVYWHFRDKADLFNALMDRAILPFEQRWLDDRATPLAPLAELVAIAADMLRATSRDGRLQRAVSISSQKTSYVGELGAIRERRLAVLARARKRFAMLLRQAQRAGELPQDARPADVARALVALIDGLVIHWLLDGRRFNLCKVGGAAVRHQLAGISKCSG
ncbi:MAG: TetR family transcriptional regulator [Rubrivivax sp.]|nr:TetR family transcriptional regulator [Burkholderiales bacterium]MCW5632081.1 TetR family transcriptional regulator [Rubrivivax sp.]